MFSQTGLSKGFGFVYFQDLNDAKDAKAELDGTTLDGRKLRVDFSLTSKPHEPTPGQYLGKKGYVSGSSNMAVDGDAGIHFAIIWHASDIRRYDMMSYDCQ